MKIFVTKYALSIGIEEVSHDVDDFKSPKKYLYYKRSSLESSILVSKKHVFTSREDAIKAAQKMKDKKIASLEKQLKLVKEIKIR